MVKKPAGWAVLCISVLGATSAWAQDASSANGSVALSTDTGAKASATSTTSATGEPSTFEPYEAGYPPDDNLLELGVFGGIFIPSRKHNLYNERFPHHQYRRGPEVGARLGWYPLSFVGIEGEAMGAASRVKVDGKRTMLFGGRGQLVLQAPFPYVVPFVTGGVGKLGAIGESVGYDTDVAWHFGIGAKIALTHALSLRLDGRDNLIPNRAHNGQSNNVEVLLGLSAVIERSRKQPPPPPADTDHDGVLDRDDKCPAELGVAPSGCPADSDGDSVLDRDDYCPKEAGPAPKGCPIIDTDPDKDGVPLPCDACPNEIGVKPDGCPIRDTDGDGIFDDKDKCPKEPETKNGFEDADGCPDTIPEKIKKFTGVVEGIYFDQGKATIRKQSTKVLANAVNVLKEFPSISLEISGHTSSEGEKAFNDKLSQERADSVKQWLVDLGIASERIKTRGFGPDAPIADNKTAAGRAKNRRIEFKVLQ